MKVIKTVALCVALFGCVSTQDTAGKKESSVQSFCDQYRRASKTIMDSRQLGMPKDQVTSILTDEAFRAAIDLAYLTPVFATDQERETAAEYFAMERYTACVEAQKAI
jgi:hypothetical protein